MATHEPNHNLRRIEGLVSDHADSAEGIRDSDNPWRAIEEALPDVLDSQVKINQEMVKTLNVMAGDLEAVKDRQDTMADDIEVIKRRQDTMADDIGRLKGGHARAEVARDAGVIALDMGLGYIRTVEKYELAVLAQSHSNEGISRSDLRSFRAADLVVQATDGSQIVFVAVEVSFTADKRDTDRALRNARLLGRFTGYAARAAIASVTNDDYVSEQVEQGLVHWHSIDQRSLEPD